MRINLNQLCVFYYAGLHKQMTLAAEALFVSTPAITMQIKKLERTLGFPVFERTRGALLFTERGQALYEAVAPIFRELDNLDRYIQDLVQVEEMELTLGTHHLPGNYFIPDLIAHVRLKYPMLKVRMELGRQDWLLEELVRHKIDLALMIGEPPDNAGYSTVHLFDDELALVTAAGSQLARLDEATPRQIADMPLILQQQGTGARRTVIDFLASHGVQPEILLDNLSSDVIKQFLPTMESVAMISRHIVQKELENGTFHEIRLAVNTQPACSFYLAYLDSPHTPMKVHYFLAGIGGFAPRFKIGVV